MSQSPSASSAQTETEGSIDDRTDKLQDPLLVGLRDKVDVNSLVLVGGNDPFRLDALHLKCGEDGERTRIRASRNLDQRRQCRVESVGMSETDYLCPKGGRRRSSLRREITLTKRHVEETRLTDLSLLRRGGIGSSVSRKSMEPTYREESRTGERGLGGARDRRGERR